jgi:hypothetical protein
MNYYDLDDLDFKHPKCLLVTIGIGLIIEIGVIISYL